MATRTVTLVTIVAGAVVHLGFLLQVFTPKSIAGLLFPLLVLSPWILLLASLRLAGQRQLAQRAALIASAIYLVAGAWTFWDTLYVHPDAQGGLVFLVLPVGASFVALALLLGIALTGRRAAPPMR